MAKKKPLMRGDSKQGVQVPAPKTKISLLEHVLYLGGFGRLTPFTSLTDDPKAAQHFAGSSGQVWLTTPRVGHERGAKWVQHEQLLRELRRPTTKWQTQVQASQARALVKRWHEHLFDWRSHDPATIATSIGAAFSRRP